MKVVGPRKHQRIRGVEGPPAPAEPYHFCPGTIPRGCSNTVWLLWPSNGEPQFRFIGGFMRIGIGSHRLAGAASSGLGLAQWLLRAGKAM